MVSGLLYPLSGKVYLMIKKPILLKNRSKITPLPAPYYLKMPLPTSPKSTGSKLNITLSSTLNTLLKHFNKISPETITLKNNPNQFLFTTPNGLHSHSNKSFLLTFKASENYPYQILPSIHLTDSLKSQFLTMLSTVSILLRDVEAF